MSVKGYANFLEKMGHNIVFINNTYWFDAHPKVYLSFPFHHTIDPDTINFSKVFSKGGVVARFSCPIGKGRLSYRISIADPNYNLSSLNGKSRNQTRRGIENCVVRELTNHEILEYALQLNTETLQRQGRNLSVKEQSYWNRYYKEILEVEGATIWGAFVQNELAAFLISVRMNHCENILIVRSKTSLLKFYPNNALIYTFIFKTMSSSEEVNEVSIGFESIQSDKDSLDRFKLGMGFKKIPIGQYITFRSPLPLILKGPIVIFVEYILCLIKNDSENLTKLYGLLRWYNKQIKKS